MAPLRKQTWLKGLSKLKKASLFGHLVDNLVDKLAESPLFSVVSSVPPPVKANSLGSMSSTGPPSVLGSAAETPRNAEAAAVNMSSIQEMDDALIKDTNWLDSVER